MKIYKPVHKTAIFIATGMSLCLASTPALAQLTAGVSTLNSVVTWLRIIAVSIATIAIMWAGFKVMFQGAKIHDVAPIVIGGIMIGSATFIASFLLS